LATAARRPPAGEEYLRLLNSMVAASAEARALGTERRRLTARRGGFQHTARRGGFRAPASPPRWRQGQASLC
jgi:hypothetical protein